jgi:hypothetical protein
VFDAVGVMIPVVTGFLVLFATEREEKSTAAAVRLECIAEEVFEKAQRYSEALTRIMKVAKVKEPIQANASWYER